MFRFKVGYILLVWLLLGEGLGSTANGSDYLSSSCTFVGYFVYDTIVILLLLPAVGRATPVATDYLLPGGAWSDSHYSVWAYFLI